VLRIPGYVGQFLVLATEQLPIRDSAVRKMSTLFVDCRPVVATTESINVMDISIFSKNVPLIKNKQKTNSVAQVRERTIPT
jgi:hypothetical protein